MELSYILIILVLLTLSVISLYSLQREREKRKSFQSSPYRHLEVLMSTMEGVNIYTLDKNFRYIFFNEFHAEDMKRVFGADIKLGLNKLTFLPDSLSSEYKSIYLKAFEGKRFQHTQRIGENFLKFEFYPNKNGPETESITILAKDITETIGHEQELERYRSDLEKMVEERSIDILSQRDFFQEIIDQVPNSIFVRNEKGEYTLVNRAFTETLGYENRHDLIGKSLFATNKNPAEAEIHFKEDQEIIKDNIVISGESQYTNLNGDQRWIYLTKQRIEVDGSYQILGVHTDVTYLKDTQRQLENTNQELTDALNDVKSFQLKLIESEKMATVGQLTAGLIHEINNPINYVAGNVDPIKLDLSDVKEWLKSSKMYKEDPGEVDITISEMENLIQGIEEGAARVRTIMINLKRFSRPDKSETVFFDVNDGIDSTISLIKPTVKARITFEKDFGDLDKIECSPGQIQQVFLNVLDNAKDAIKDKGIIRVCTYQKDNQLFIDIEDNGIGISEADQKKVFEPFFTTKEKGHGTGLGLAISKRIISEHNGSLSVESEVGKGTTLRISLPTKRASDHED